MQKAERPIELQILLALSVLLFCCAFGSLIRATGGGWGWWTALWLYAVKWILLLVFDLPADRS
jgi:hypothetical protein